MNYLLFADKSLDGFVTAMMLHYKAIYDGYPNIRIAPYTRALQLPKIEYGDRLMFVSVSPTPTMIEELIHRIGVKVVVLDHHTVFNDEMGYDFLDWHNLPYFFVQDGAETDLFCKPDPEKNPGKIGTRFYFTNNDVQNKPASMKRSSVGIALDLFKKNDPDFVSFLNTFFCKELMRLVTLTQNHELWVHDNNPKSEAYLLNQWFKNWILDKDYLFEEMKKYPEKSHDIFIQLKSDFFVLRLDEKIRLGKNMLARTRTKIDRLANSPKSVQVSICPYGAPDMAVCYVTSLDITDLSPGVVGNDLVKNHGWDVAILDGGVERNDRVYYMYSNPDGADIDVLAIADKLLRDGLIDRRIGRSNAVTLYDHKNSRSFINLKCSE